MLTPWKESYDQPRQHIKNQRHYFTNKGPSNQDYGFSSGHVWMWELDYKESWALKNWYFWIMMLKKTLESPLDCKEIQPVNPKGNQPWIFIGRTDAEAETPVLWPPDAKKWLICKDPDAGKDWRWEEKRMTEDEMVGWHHLLMDTSLSKFQQFVMNRESWHAAVHGVTKIWTWLSDCKEIQPVHPKGDQSWVFLEGLMLKLKLQCFGHLMRRSDSFEKTLMLGKFEGRRRRGCQEDETVGWHHQLNGHEFE